MKSQEKEKSYEQLISEAHELREEISKSVETFEQRKYLTEGIALGLFYGIIGNIVVSHYYGLFQGLATRNFDDFFRINLFVFVVSLAVVLVITYGWLQRLKGLEGKRKELLELTSEMKELTEQLLAKQKEEDEAKKSQKGDE